MELTLFGQGTPTISPIPPTHPFYATRPCHPACRSRGCAQVAGAGRSSERDQHPDHRAGRPPGARAPGRDTTAARQARRLRPAGAARAVFQLSTPRYRARRRCMSTAISRVRRSTPAPIRSCIPAGSWNEKLWHYNDPKVDKALEAARLSGDAAVQKSSTSPCRRALNANPAGFFAYVVNFACAYRKSVGEHHRRIRCAGSTCAPRPKLT